MIQSAVATPRNPTTMTLRRPRRCWRASTPAPRSVTSSGSGRPTPPPTSRRTIPISVQITVMFSLAYARRTFRRIDERQDAVALAQGDASSHLHPLCSRPEPSRATLSTARRRAVPSSAPLGGEEGLRRRRDEESASGSVPLLDRGL